MAAFYKGFSVRSKERIISLLQKMVAELMGTFIMMFLGCSSMVAELMGTFIMMFLGCSSVFIDKRNDITFVGVAFTWTATIVAMGYTFGHISGCHMNPAVTIGFATAKLFPWKQVPFYAMAQLTGATIACLMVSWLFNGEQTSLMLTLPGGPNPVGNLQAFSWEIIISCILMLVIRGAGTDPRAAKQLGGIAVPAVLFSNIIAAGKITGASMNPARSLAPAIVTNNFKKIWIYLIAPVIGTVIGSALYNFFKISMNVEEKILPQQAITDTDNNIAMENLTHSGNSLEIL
ncbi:nodulin-26-like [Dendrobium catenatum]|uniref:nodulin-26-like n=1 Tax=Dendrobium catenatum TaxID=906689 RepID=UPI0009F23945|nr:nodulin-26-like [Dendrobium catenatum]